MKSHEKNALIQLLCLPNWTQHFFTWGWDQKFIVFDLQLKEESDFLHTAAIQAGQKIQSKFQRKQIFLIFNDFQDMLQNVDEIISWPFPVNWVFNQRLTNIEVGFILKPFFDYNWIMRLKVCLKLVFNSIAVTVVNSDSEKLPVLGTPGPGTVFRAV